MKVPYFSQQTLYTCGPAATRMVLKFYGVLKSEKELTKALKTAPQNGTSFTTVKKYAKKLGLRCVIHHNIRPQEKGLERLREYATNGIPTMVTVNRYVYDKKTLGINQNVKWESKNFSYHIVVVTKIDENNAYFNDPHKIMKRAIVPIKKFMKAWYSGKWDGYIVAITK